MFCASGRCESGFGPRLRGSGIHVYAVRVAELEARQQLSSCEESCPPLTESRLDGSR
jgi:hypothetical protein